MKTVCVYCGSADRTDGKYLNAASEMGAELARRGLRLVYGAGSTGLMGAVANGALAAGGAVTGVMPSLFNTATLAHTGLKDVEVVGSLHERKARMAELADGFVALPGGYGTLDEMFEILTWAQIGLHKKPIGLLNTGGYYDLLLQFIEQMGREGFIYSQHSGLFCSAATPVELLNAMESYKSPKGLERWLTREESGE